MFQTVGRDLGIGSQDTDSHRQVIAGTLLLDVSRLQVDGDVHRRHFQAVVDQCRLDAVVAFLDGSVRQSRQMKLHTTRHAHLTSDSRHLESVNGSSIGLYKHNIIIFACKDTKNL